MRKLIFTLAIAVIGALAYAAGSPASAMTASPVAGMSEIVKSDATVQKVYHHRRWGHHRHWRFRHHGYRHCWWRHGHRYCRWGY